jgi:hypothetical protein
VKQCQDESDANANSGTDQERGTTGKCYAAKYCLWFPKSSNLLLQGRQG